MIPYKTFTSLEKVESIIVRIETLQDLDQAIDDLCNQKVSFTPAEQDELLRLCPYFGIIWPSARALAEFLMEHRNEIRGKKVLEVGCGLALPSIIAAKLGATVTALDFHPDVEAFLTVNLKLNSTRIHYECLDQRAELPKHLTGFDILLASDVLYEKDHTDALVQTAHKVLAPGGKMLLADPGRTYLDRFLLAMKNAGYQMTESIKAVEESSPQPEHRLTKQREIFVYEFFK